MVIVILLTIIMLVSLVAGIEMRVGEMVACNLTGLIILWALVLIL